jgi:signal transduction histidine kinase
MAKQGVWVIDPDTAFRRKVEDRLCEDGFQVTGLERIPQSRLWNDEHALIISADLLPVQNPPATVVALIAPEREADQPRALESGARWFVPRDPAWLPHLSAVLEALQVDADRQIPAVLNQASPYAEARCRAEDFATLNEVAARIGHSLELQDVLEAAMDQVIILLDMEACIVSLVNEEAGELVLCAQRGLRFSHLGKCTPLAQGLPDRIVSAGEALVTGDVGQDPRLAAYDFAREQIHAMVIVPMHSRSRVVGTLGAISRNSHEFTEQEVALLWAIGNQVGTAVENARLYQAVKEHVASLEGAYTRLQEVDRVKEEFIQNVSHELRTPLTFLMGYVDLLLDGQLGSLAEAQHKGLEIVARKTNQVIRLVEGITTMEKVNLETLDLRPVDLGQLARMALEGCRFVATEADIELQEEIPDGLPWALADGVRIDQVFDNLLGNAIKFSPDGGTITVRVREEDGWLRVEVSDTGVGIPDEKLSRIFDRFYQVDGSSRRRFGGIGLGLAIVKLIVEAHGGQVWVESKVGEGSTFCFTLRKAPQKPEG